MATIADISDALAQQLATIPGLRVFDHPPQSTSPPVAFVVLQQWEPLAMRRAGHKSYGFSVMVFTAQSVRPQDGYRALMEYADAGSKSIELAVWDGNEPATGSFLGLANTSAQVTGFSVLGVDLIDAFEMYGGEFLIEVHTKG